MTWIDDFVRLGQEQIDDEVREALWGRGVDDQQIELYKLGFYSGEVPVEMDLPESFSRWAHGLKSRLGGTFVLPLTNTLGEVRGLQFRAVDRSRSGYLDYFIDETEPVLFGLGQAMDPLWSTEEVWLVEGAFDLFPIQRVFPNVVSTLTARITEPFLRVLRRLVKRIYLSYDMDETGRRACSKIVKLEGFDVIKDVEYPEVVKVDGKKAKDPNDYWEAWGDDRLAAFLRCNVQTPPTESNHAERPFIC